MSHILQVLYRCGWEFWLPLPVVALAFWIFGNAITLQVLSRPYESVNTLQADTQSAESLSTNILSMNAEIEQTKGITTVFVRIDDPVIREVKYTFQITEISQIERAIAQKLKVDVDTIRKLISYRIKD